MTCSPLLPVDFSHVWNPSASHELSCRADLRPRDVRPRVEIEAHAVGAPGLVDVGEPGVDLADAHLRERDQPLRRVEVEELVLAMLDRVGEAKDRLRHADIGVPLVEAAFTLADRTAQERQRALEELREHDRHDRLVVAGEVELREGR